MSRNVSQKSLVEMLDKRSVCALPSSLSGNATLFDDPAARTRSVNLMAGMDAINSEFGRGSLG